MADTVAPSSESTFWGVVLDLKSLSAPYLQSMAQQPVKNLTEGAHAEERGGGDSPDMRRHAGMACTAARGREHE